MKWLGLVLAGVFAFTGNGAWSPRRLLNAPASLAPGRVTDLRVAAATDTSLVLTWTEVASSTSAIARYVVRVDTAPFPWYTRPDVTTGGCAAPVYGSTAAGGRTRSCVLGSLAARRQYYVKLTAYTGTLNSTAVFGPESNLVTATTAVRVGPMLVHRPPMALGVPANPSTGQLLDSVTVAAASLSYFGPTRFPLRGRFLFGDGTATFYDSTGAVVARGHLLVVKP